MWYNVAMMKNYTFTNDQFWPFFFDLCVQFVQLTTVGIRINRLVHWKRFKKYYAFPIPPNRQHNLFSMQFSFRCCVWWFITLGPWSFPSDVIAINPFLITSDNSFQKIIEFIAFNMFNMSTNKCQKEKIMTSKEAIQKDGQRHLYVKSAITSGTVLIRNWG